jgi:hypothetical protein
MVLDTASIWSFMTTLHDLLCVAKFMERAVLNQGTVGLAIFLQGEEMHNVLKRDHLDKCCKEGAREMV